MSRLFGDGLALRTVFPVLSGKAHRATCSVGLAILALYTDPPQTIPRLYRIGTNPGKAVNPRFPIAISYHHISGF